MTNSTVQIFSAVVSAIGVVLSAFAAFRSASSARQAQRTVAEAERRASLRQVALTATEVLVEFRRAQARGNEAKRAYGGLAAFSRNTGSDRQVMYVQAIEDKIQGLVPRADNAKLFAFQSEKLLLVPMADIERVQTDLSNSLTEIRALREDLEREHALVHAQCEVYRERAIRGPTQL